ncbi:hypothetical protein LI82_11075 [Methanococcoides methylutens]|uniref:Uncharacterized protein n=1 Tax=Methanococcoides methylutens TaxID=2226 RepID=A0A099T1X5_METMT|nr:hypothetical protein [Methanococcoides methylutens]KGK98251.1 hypothetical protein LI82_11075 [Methanococcoides methylutens]
MVNGLADIWISIIKNNFQMLGLNDSKPRGIIILGIFVGLSAVLQLFCGFAGYPLYIQGYALQSGFVFYVYFLYALISVSLAYGFLKLKKVVFYPAIFWFLWGTANGISNYLALADIEIIVDSALSFAFLSYVYSKKKYFVN